MRVQLLLLATIWRSVLIVPAVVLLLAVPAWAEEFTGKVVGVGDGDTVTVLREKTPVKIRLHGVDCPEKAQPFGTKAKQFTSDMVFGKVVTVKVATKDKYGRTVAWIEVGGKSLSEELLRAGLAWHYRQYDKIPKLAKLEQEAKAAKKGLWADADPTPPWEWHGPDLVCRQDTDCVFLPSICHGCAPCKPTPRRVGNQQALRRIQNTQARVRCAMPRCPPCADEKNWLAGKLVCGDGRCAFDKAAASVAPTKPASGGVWWRWRVCKVDGDCVLLPADFSNSRCSCAPCGRVHRAAANKKAYDGFMTARARIRCVPFTCPACASLAIESKATCIKGLCEAR